LPRFHRALMTRLHLKTSSNHRPTISTTNPTFILRFASPQTHLPPFSIIFHLDTKSKHVKHFTTAFSRSRQITKRTTSSIFLLFKNLIYSNCFAINFALLLQATGENFVFFPFSVQFVRPKCFFLLLPSRKKSFVRIDNRIYWVVLKLRMGKVNREAVKGTRYSHNLITRHETIIMSLNKSTD
jgi:hypothetical protein